MCLKKFKCTSCAAKSNICLTHNFKSTVVVIAWLHWFIFVIIFQIDLRFFLINGYTHRKMSVPYIYLGCEVKEPLFLPTSPW